MVATYRFDPYALGLDVKKIKDVEAYCLCPYHNDKNPSASFNMEKGWFHCFACGATASAKDLAEITGGEVRGVGVTAYGTAPTNEADEMSWSKILFSPLATNNWYLGSRMVPNFLVERYEILCVNENTVAFPFMENGVVVGYQTRSMFSKQYRFFGRRRTIWTEESIPAYETPIYVTEGVFGALRGLSAGLVAVAICGSSNVSGLIRYAGSDMYTMFDDDRAGHVATARALAMGLPYCKVKNLEPDELTVDQWEKIDKNRGRFFSYSLARLIGRAKRFGEEHVKKVTEAYRKESLELVR